MKIELEGKVAVVSGSTGGIGFAIARHLAEAGAQVVINGRTPERVQSAIQNLQAGLPSAKTIGVTADLETASGCDVLTKAVPTADILVNNLGIFEAKPFTDIDDGEWLRFFETNVMSGVRLSRHYLPAQIAQGWGRIVFISSESAVNIPVEMVHYGMTKTAQLSVARGLAESLAGTGITVNSVLPGPTRSRGVKGFLEKMAAEVGQPVATLEKEFFMRARPSSLIRRFAEPAEVAALVTYVVSPLASATTGAALRADGGIVRSPF
jgi:NAD(P)-dependent dehydrogenase (short-subunit alcohol dehydrogenase family)